MVLKTIRSGICDMQFFGFINLYKFPDFKNLIKIAKDDGCPFFMRSLAKPLQASIMKDFDTHNFYKMTTAEIAIVQGSHSGENYHTEIIRNLLLRAGISENALKCGCHAPLGNHKNVEPINNNCSAKHALMLLVCKQMGFDVESYLDFEHGVQVAIKKKIAKLCEIDEKMMVESLDGCNAPIYALPFENIARGYANLFFNKDYDFMLAPILNNPLIYGGENRLDSEIIAVGGGNLFAKVGAGGFVVVLNLENREILLIKMAQDNNVARKILVSKLLYKLEWIPREFADDKIYNLHGVCVSRYEMA